MYNRDSAAFNFYIDGSANQSILRPQKNVTCLNICVYLIYDCSIHSTFRETTTRRGASLTIQRYRVRERKWQTRETLARGVYGGYTPLHTNGKEKNGTTRNIEGMHFF